MAGGELPRGRAVDARGCGLDSARVGRTLDRPCGDGRRRRTRDGRSNPPRFVARRRAGVRRLDLAFPCCRLVNGHGAHGSADARDRLSRCLDRRRGLRAARGRAAPAARDDNRRYSRSGSDAGPPRGVLA